MYYINIFANHSKRITRNKIRYTFNRKDLQGNLPLNYIDNTLKNVSFNIYLSTLNIYNYLYIYINIVIIYYNNTHKNSLITKRICRKEAGKYLNINLNNYFNSFDLNNFKLIHVDVYSKNAALYLTHNSTSKTPFINFELNQYKNFTSSNYYNNLSNLLKLYLSKSKNKNIALPCCNNNYTIPDKNTKFNNNNNNNNNDDDDDINTTIPINNIAPYNNLKESEIKDIIFEHKPANTESYKYEGNSITYLLLKFINKYIQVKIEFNGIKVLQGILDKVTNDIIILKDGCYNHIVLIDSISIIHTSENIDTLNIAFNDKSSDISKALKYLKNNNIKINLNDKYMNISTVKIVNYCDSFVEVEDTNTKKTYFFNSAHIKTIEWIPQK